MIKKIMLIIVIFIFSPAFSKEGIFFLPSSNIRSKTVFDKM